VVVIKVAYLLRWDREPVLEGAAVGDKRRVVGHTSAAFQALAVVDAGALLRA
jgi:hypothetical protein